MELRFHCPESEMKRVINSDPELNNIFEDCFVYNAAEVKTALGF